MSNAGGANRLLAPTLRPTVGSATPNLNRNRNLNLNPSSSTIPSLDSSWKANEHHDARSLSVQVENKQLVQSVWAPNKNRHNLFAIVKAL